MDRLIEPDRATAYRAIAAKRLAEGGLARSSERFVAALLPEWNPA
jgi:hypothetical protein